MSAIIAPRARNDADVRGRFTESMSGLDDCSQAQRRAS
jgi:hypothetical protein